MQFASELLRQCWFLAGPTASGKSEVGIRIARRANAEILALDSMSLYRGMDIGTAKATAEQQASVPHHLIDILDPHEEFSLADYVTAAERTCREIVTRGRVPLFVGGTGLYLRGILRGVFEGPPANWEFRRQLEAEAANAGENFLHRRLTEVDAAAAAVLHPRDTRRLIRALEVHHLTGQPLSEQQQQRPLPPDERPGRVLWISPPRPWLHERINRRVEQMFAAGLVDEVRRLLDRPAGLSHTARQALGYKEVIDMLEHGRPLADTLAEIQTRTRQFAKRQHTWFRNLVECRPLEITGTETPDEIADRFLTAN